MAVSNITRNLRDGELIIKDGTAGTPQSLTVLLDDGDLSWTVRSSTIEVTDRGSISKGHTRPGDEESVSLSFTARWTQLIGKSANPADPLQLYETLMLLSGTDLVSTSAVGEEQTLRFEFTALDPSGVSSERGRGDGLEDGGGLESAMHHTIGATRVVAHTVPLP